MSGVLKTGTNAVQITLVSETMKTDAGSRDHLPLLEAVAAALPRFPDERIDYSHARVALVINCIVRHDGKILLVRRSGLVALHGNRWGCVTGFIDRFISLEALVGCELREELSVDVASASEVRCANPFRSVDDAAAKVWLVYPVLVTFEQRPRIRLNWENGAFRWIRPAEIDNFRVIPGQARALAVVIGKDW